MGSGADGRNTGRSTRTASDALDAAARTRRLQQAALGNDTEADEPTRPGTPTPTSSLPSAGAARTEPEITTLALSSHTGTVVEEQTLQHGLLAQQSEAELTVVQGLVEAAKVGFPSKAILTTLTRTLTEALGRLHSFEASYYLIYYQAQTVQAMWVVHDRARSHRCGAHHGFCQSFADQNGGVYALLKSGVRTST